MARPRKIDDNLLIEIIKLYINSNVYITKLKFSDLAEFANNMGYTDIKYTDFYRNKTASEVVDNFNKNRNQSKLKREASDGVYYYNFLVEEVVEKHHKNMTQLKAILNIFKESYDKAFKELSRLKEKIDNYQSENVELKDKLRESNNIIKQLRHDNNKLKDKIKEAKKDEKSNCILEGIKYLVETKNIAINNESDILNILMNFKDGNGYQSDTIDTSELLSEIDKEKIHINDIDDKNEILFGIEKELNNKKKVIEFERKKEKLNLPDFMK
ncbi:hypothetical protein QTI96_01585 [Clostridium perfringens]|nr:hypothetical protein [Clostridium perfringens]